VTTAERRVRREVRTVEAMVEMHCRARHRRPAGECAECAALMDYVRVRVARCPFQPNKPTCAKCSIHCYNPGMRERIRAVMRFAGPRMTWRHPVLALLHLLDGKRPAPPRP
jgi:hypothetical protein